MPSRARRLIRSLIDCYKQATTRINPKPTFILGHAKSGTTAIGSLLAKATDSSYSNDPLYQSLNLRKDPYALPPLVRGELSLNQFIKKSRRYFSQQVIKDPEFIFIYHHLKSLYPDSEYAFVVRDPQDNIRSILNRLNLPGNLSHLPEDNYSNLPSHRAWRVILKGEPFNFEGENYIETLACRWRLAARIYIENSSRIQLIRYEDFLKNKSDQIHSLAHRLNMTSKKDITHEVNQQYQPKGDSLVTPKEFFGSKNLEAICDICGEEMSAFGYQRRGV